jgi:hypothetical protein
MATTQDLAERVEALEKAVAELHAQYVPPKSSSTASKAAKKA